MTGKKGFKGLPSPAAAGCIASLAILKGVILDRFEGLNPTYVGNVIEVWAIFGALFVALLMVSNIPYPKMTKKVLSGRRHFDQLILLVVAGFTLAVVQQLAVALIFWGYVAAILAHFVWARMLHRQPEALPATDGPAIDQ